MLFHSLSHKSIIFPSQALIGNELLIITLKQRFQKSLQRTGVDKFQLHWEDDQILVSFEPLLSVSLNVKISTHNTCVDKL